MALQVWLPLTKDTRNQGLATGTINWTTAASFTDNGKLGKALTTGGCRMPASMTSQVLNNTSVSIACWLYVNADADDSSNRAMIFGNDTMSSLGGRQFSIFRYPNSDDIHLSWQNYNNGTYSGAVVGGVWSGVLTPRAWNHICVTYQNPNVKVYVNGIQVGSTSGVINTSSFAYDTDIIHSSSSHYINDFRIYDNCLSPMEVKELAKGLVLHYLLKGNTLVSQYDNNLYVEPDGSVWTRVFHHNNPSNALFTSSDTFSTGVYKDTNRWYDIETISNIASTWEFMVKQKTTSSASEVKYRWIQTKNPVNSVWADVQPSAVTRITTSGYTDGGYGGLWKQNSGTRMVIANSNSGNWYGAAGSWSAYNGGIPGYPNTTITTGYIDIYIRVDNLNSTIYDSSGYCNNAQSNGSIGLTYSTDSPKYKVATVFASGARIATSVSASTFMPKDTITVSIWFKSSAAANRFISCTEGGGFNFESNSGNIRFVSYIAGQGYAYANSSTTWSSVSDNNWHMITATNDRQTIKIYLDGTLIQETTCQYSGTTLGYASSTPFTLGAEAQSIASPIAGTYVGSLADCRIYATALSADDVKSLYQNNAYIDSSGTIYGKIRD